MKLKIAIALVAGMASSLAHADTPSRVDRIKETGEIRIGHPDASIPFSFLGPNEQPIGYSVEICQDVARLIQQKLGMADLKIQYVSTTSATRIPLIGNGTIDLECGNTTNKEDRKKQVSFAPTTFVAEVVLGALKGSGVDVNDLSSFKGKTIAATQGGHDFQIVASASAKNGYDITMAGAPDNSRAFMLLESGRADGAVSDNGLLYAQVATSRNPDAFVLGTRGLELAPYGIIEPKDDAAFKTLVDDSVKELMKDGTVTALYEKYFNSPLPPKNINLKLPMSDALKKAIANPTDASDPAAYGE
jgi:glutamate/aspartate transport system substrate-binding protein